VIVGPDVGIWPEEAAGWIGIGSILHKHSCSHPLWTRVVIGELHACNSLMSSQQEGNRQIYRGN
jgi:hypothetical protein